MWLTSLKLSSRALLRLNNSRPMRLTLSSSFFPLMMTMISIWSCLSCLRNLSLLIRIRLSYRWRSTFITIQENLLIILKYCVKTSLLLIRTVWSMWRELNGRTQLRWWCSSIRGRRDWLDCKINRRINIENLIIKSFTNFIIAWIN